MMSDASLAIGVDIGGTDIKIGFVDRDLTIVAKSSIPFAPGEGEEPSASVRHPAGGAGVAEVVDRIGQAIEDLEARCGLVAGGLCGVGVGTPGPMSPSRGVVFASPNLPGWQDVNLRDAVARRVRRPAVLDNDANLAAYGEYRRAAVDEMSDMVLLTLGTGVGTGAIIGGRILHGHFENASEWGHAIVQPGGRPCNCGQRGCLEQYVSAANIARRVVEEIRAGASSSLAEAVEDGQDISAAEVVAAVRTGDALAGRIWDEACSFLAIACVNMQHALNPRRIMLGGGMSRAGRTLLDPVRAHFEAARWRIHDDYPRITLARLGNDAGIIGAAALAFDTFGSAAR